MIFEQEIETEKDGGSKAVAVEGDGCLRGKFWVEGPEEDEGSEGSEEVEVERFGPIDVGPGEYGTNDEDCGGGRRREPRSRP